jgi:hypothetical protein
MSSYEFSLRLNREVTDAEVEALYEAGCDDAAVETGPLGTMIGFDREAPSLAEAITSAVRDVEKVPDLRAVGVACDSMVTLLGIAERAGVSREAVRLWAAGQRGPGGFPRPVMITHGGEGVWEWEKVVPWLLENGPGRQKANLWTCQALLTSKLHVLFTADRVLRARDALRSEPDDVVRKELERLLEDA